MGTAIDVIKMDDKIHSMAYTEIHRYIQMIIPYLEQRRLFAKQITDYNISSDSSYSVRTLISRCNDELKRLLDVEPFETINSELNKQSK